MKSSREWVESDIIQMIEDREKESLYLDYKACGSLAKTDGKKTEVSKDISSFANSAGGVIIYGVLEEDNLPIAIDTGFDQNEFSKEWLENIIHSNIHPKIDDLHINQIDLKSQGTGKAIYVVTIPQSTFMFEEEGKPIELSPNSKNSKELKKGCYRPILGFMPFCSEPPKRNQSHPAMC